MCELRVITELRVENWLEVEIVCACTARLVFAYCDTSSGEGEKSISQAGEIKLSCNIDWLSLHGGTVVTVGTMLLEEQDKEERETGEENEAD